MPRFPIAMLLAISSATFCGAALEAVRLRTEYLTDPLGIDAQRPRLYWQIESDTPGTMQKSYEIRAVRIAPTGSPGKTLWKSKRVDSDRTTQIEYGGPALSSGERVSWQVRVWDNHGRKSKWSDSATWEMGLLNESDWTANWIEADIPEDTTKSAPAQYFRRDFSVDKPVAAARLYVTAHGVYEASLNGHRIGNAVLPPGWTSYSHRIEYQVYDVTALVAAGDNTIGATVGDGWWRGYLGWKDRRNVYGDKLALICQLEITHADGSVTRIGSDADWRASTGPILSSDLYNGEIYDARLENAGWNTPGFDASGWSPVVVRDFPKIVLIATINEPIRRIEELHPVSVIPAGEGKWLYDLGQNMVGHARLTIAGEPGRTIELRHVEVLNPDGTIYGANLRAAQQIVRYTCKGGGEETYEPHFTVQGFRFVELSGAATFPGIDAITGVVIHSDLRPAGTFSCSDPLINQLQGNIRWGMKGNFLDVPTDCPQRDERLGWTGDTQVFAPTASFLMDTAAFYTKWTGDVRADQFPDGTIPNVIPDVLKEGKAAGWADAAVIVPWTVYEAYGDTRILADNFECMRAWVDRQWKAAPDSLIANGAGHFGDWLYFKSDGWNLPDSATNKDVIATAYFAHTADIVAKSAALIGRTKDAAKYAGLHNRIRTAFEREFITPAGRLMSDTQTAYVLALSFGLVPDAQVQAVADQLATNVRKYGHLTTGFLGTPQLNASLSSHGHAEVAFDLLMRRDYPSWLYPVTQGATTIWERWDGIKPDGTFQTPGMNSFNHYAYGAVGDWMYRTIGGIQATSPGYDTFRIAPTTGGGLTHATTTYDSIHGRISSAWKITDGTFTLEATVPPNTTAEISVPAPGGADSVAVTSGPSEAISSKRFVDGRVVFAAGSGTYRFAARLPAPAAPASDQ